MSPRQQEARTSVGGGPGPNTALLPSVDVTTVDDQPTVRRSPR